MPLETILIILLILVLVGVAPVWPHSTAYGYWPSGIVGLVLVILVVVLLLR